MLQPVQDLLPVLGDGKVALGLAQLPHLGQLLLLLEGEEGLEDVPELGDHVPAEHVRALLLVLETDPVEKVARVRGQQVEAGVQALVVGRGNIQVFRTG